MNLKEYILACIGEEGGEITKASSKCLRFGLTDTHPIEGYKNNIDSLIQEVNDLIAVVELLGEKGYADISKLNNSEAKQAKKEKFFKYLYYSRKCGTYQPEPEPAPVFTEAVCRGCKQLNSHCGWCQKCVHYGWTK
jgi:hypothetical protein